ncbi:MAG: rod-binding protein [Campylobacterales bacterium]|nr:rod-binding protein [Campylobacterales bacterium]
MSYLDSISSQAIASANNLPKIDKNVENKALKEQTDAFESVIIKMMLDNASKDEKNLFTEQNDPGEKIYRSMYRDELAKASAGGFGFSQMLYDYLSNRS